MTVQGSADGRRAVVGMWKAAVILGIGRTFAYRPIKEGKWPTSTIRMGRLINDPVGPLMDYLGRHSRSWADRPDPSGVATAVTRGSAYDACYTFLYIDRCIRMYNNGRFPEGCILGPTTR